ncbi:hypothetical protein EVA_07214 [gut metagenome]|uniref:Uncharacterized protein n=1 Tax=gut metagenome TaxID=749906 RepID=J9GCT3_9ZZZZ
MHKVWFCATTTTKPKKWWMPASMPRRWRNSKSWKIPTWKMWMPTFSTAVPT